MHRFLFISLNLGLASFLLLLHFGQDGEVFEKWMQLKGNGKWSKLWNRSWGNVFILIILVVPLYISMFLGPMAHRQPVNDELQIPQNFATVLYNDITMLSCITFTTVFAISKKQMNFSVIL